MAGGCRPSGSLSGVPPQIPNGSPAVGLYASYGQAQQQFVGGNPGMCSSGSLGGSLRSFPGSAAGGAATVAMPMVRHYSGAGSHSSGSLAGVAPGGGGAMQVKGTSGPAIYSGPYSNYGPYGRQPDGADVRASQLPALQEQLDKLRHASAVQQEQIGELFQELKEAREGKLRLQCEVDSARSASSRLSEELSRERMAREQAEAAAAQGQQALERNLAEREVWPSHGDPAAGAYAPSCNRGACTASFGKFRPPSAPPASSSPGDRPDRAPEVAAPLGLAAAATSVQPADNEGDRTATDRRPSRSLRPRGSAKDDIDARLFDFLQNTDCSLVFRRKNRGWYLFRQADEGGRPSSDDRSVELSIVNGKLMARVEPSGPHDKGWNNGKLGPLERFVTFFSTARDS